MPLRERLKKQRQLAKALGVVMDHRAHTPYFRAWLCNMCNTRIVALVDMFGPDEFVMLVERAFRTACTTIGGFTAN